jgi:rubrerythrin
MSQSISNEDFYAAFSQYTTASGKKSNQKFINSYNNFEYNVSHQISLKILPLGTKNKTTDDIKHYCTECGTKTKSKYKFCPSCGNKI